MAKGRRITDFRKDIFGLQEIAIELTNRRRLLEELDNPDLKIKIDRLSGRLEAPRKIRDYLEKNFREHSQKKPYGDCMTELNALEAYEIGRIK